MDHTPSKINEYDNAENLQPLTYRLREERELEGQDTFHKNAKKKKKKEN